MLTPIIRGAFMHASGGPVILLSDKKEKPGLPVLNIKGPAAPWAGHGSASDYSAAVRKSESEIGLQASDALAALKADDGSLPAAVTVPGFGSFFAGITWEAADKVRRGVSSTLERQILPLRGDPVRGRIALVTGGAQGFGAEIARGLVDAGSFVIIADINADGAQAFADKLNADGPKMAAAVAVDVSDEESVKAMADSIVDQAGGLDLLVSNAGVLRAGSVLELSAPDFEFVTKINYSAFFLVVKQTAPILIRQQASAPSHTSDIIQINSKSGLEGSNKNGAYAGGKFGGIGLVQSFAMELVEYSIKVNAICPGNFFDGPLWSDPDRGLFIQYLNTGKVPGAKSVADVKKFYENKVPMGRGCEGEDVLKAILYCVDQAYETGQAVPVTGGQVMLK
jgi:sorbitol-6-phosphate 2-dehydrogenase